MEREGTREEERRGERERGGEGAKGRREEWSEGEGRREQSCLSSASFAVQLIHMYIPTILLTSN